jgi:hypothetical protein
MYSARSKIHKDKDAEPTEFEEGVAQVTMLLFILTILQHISTNCELLLLIVLISIKNYF